MKRDVIDLSTLNVFTLFRKYFVPTLLGMLSMSAVTAIDGIFVGHGVGSDGIAAVNICVPLLMLFTGIGLMVGAGCSVVASIQLSRGKSKSARLNVTQALLFVTIVALIPSVLMMAFPVSESRPTVYRPSQRPSLRFRMLPSPFARRFGMVSAPFATNNTVTKGTKLLKSETVIRKLSFVCGDFRP